MHSVVVTGVSRGIGWSAAKLLVQKGFRVFGSVRRAEDAERLKRELGEALIPLTFDITDERGVRAAAAEVRARLDGETLFGLVNNAGIAVPAALMYLPTEDFRHQIEVNLVGALIVTKAFVPLLGSDRSLRGDPGRIVNIGSASGKRGNPFVGAYVASKHALEGFSESLRRELMIFGIDVVIVAPGPVATPIWEVAARADLSTYEHTDYAEAAKLVQAQAIRNGETGLPPEEVAKVILRALTIPKPRVRYALAPGGFFGRAGNTIQRMLPKRSMDRIIAKRLFGKQKARRPAGS